MYVYLSGRGFTNQDGCLTEIKLGLALLCLLTGDNTNAPFSNRSVHFRGGRVNKTYLPVDVEKPFLFSDFAALPFLFSDLAALPFLFSDFAALPFLFSDFAALPFLFSDLAALTAKSEKINFSASEKAGIAWLTLS